MDRLVNTLWPYNVIRALTDMSSVILILREREKVPTGVGNGGSEKAMRFMSWVAKKQRELIK